jgi:hypothetical protein
MTSLLPSPVRRGRVRPGPETAPGASPILDIGGEVGALVVYLTETTPSGELEACPAGRPDQRFHTGVHPRVVGPDTVPVAVFPEVAGGSYELLDVGGEPLALVRVAGGQVSEVDLRRR